MNLTLLASAVRGSADRLELCANLGLGGKHQILHTPADYKGYFIGGTTPSIGLLKAVQRAVPNTPIMVCA